MSFVGAQGHRFTPMALIAGLTFLYALTGLLSLSVVAPGPITPSSIFFPEGIGLAAVLRFGAGVWPGILLGQLLLGVLHDAPFSGSLAVGSINSVIAILGVTLFRHFKGDPSLATIRDLAVLLCLALVLQPLGTTATMYALHGLGATDVVQSTFWLDWWFGNVLSHIIVAPLLLSLAFQRNSDRWIVAELIPLSVLLILLCWLTLMKPPFISPALPFAVFTPLLVITALRYGLGPGSAATLLVACMTLLAEHVALGQSGQYRAIAQTDLNIFLLGIVPAVQSIAILSRQQLHSASRLTNLQKQYQRIFEQAPVLANAFDQHGRCVLWNDECAKVFGYSREFILSHPDPLGLFYPDRSERDRVLKASHQDSQASGLIEWHPLRHDGSPLNTLWSNVPVANGITFNVGVDITEHKQIEKRLRIAASVFEHSYDGIVIVSPQKTIVDINPSCARLLGYPVEDLLGTPIATYRPLDHSAKFYEALWHGVEVHDFWQGEVWMQHSEGRKRPLNTSVITVRDDDHSILRYIIVFTDISALKAKELELQRMAHFDPLTGLPNRYLLNDRLKQAISNARRSNTLMAVCYLDLDGFKQINDNMGHDAGDAVLIEVARRIQTTLRRKDTVARLGGDEMALLLTNLGRPDDSREVLDRVLLNVAESITLANGIGQVSASIGVSFFPHDGATFDVLLSKADTAMYQAKRSGKNRYYFYSPSDHGLAVTTS